MKIKFVSLGIITALIAGGALTAFKNKENIIQPSEIQSASKADELKWYSLEEAQTAGKKEKRKYMIDIFTDWCGWCKVMDKKTFSAADVASVLSTKYYPVKFNAEQTENLIFKDKVYKYNGSTNELVNVWLGTSFGYPTTVFLDEKLNVIGTVSGFKDAAEFKKILTFFDNEVYKKGVSVEQYLSSKGK
jgi:thioredoxin-related protein